MPLILGVIASISWLIPIPDRIAYRVFSICDVELAVVSKPCAVRLSNPISVSELIRIGISRALARDVAEHGAFGVTCT